MARKPNTETARLLEVRNGKIDQLSQIADQIQHLRDTAAHLHSDVEKLDFALTVLDPNHVPMDAHSNNGGRLLIDAKPEHVEVKTVETSVDAATVEPEAAPKRQTSTTTKGKAKKGATAKKASTRQAKSEPLPKAAVEAAESLNASRAQPVSDKEQMARDIVNGYMANIKPGDEIEAILKKGPKRGMTVSVITEKFIKIHSLSDAKDEVLMKLKNRISSNIAALMKKGVVAKGKPEGETLTHYFFQKKGKATPAIASEAVTAETTADPAEHAA